MEKEAEDFRYFYNLDEDPCRGEECKLLVRIIFLSMSKKSRNKLIRDLLDLRYPLEKPEVEVKLKQCENGGLVD